MVSWDSLLESVQWMRTCINFHSLRELDIKQSNVSRRHTCWTRLTNCLGVFDWTLILPWSLVKQSPFLCDTVCRGDVVTRYDLRVCATCVSTSANFSSSYVFKPWRKCQETTAPMTRTHSIAMILFFRSNTSLFLLLTTLVSSNSELMFLARKPALETSSDCFRIWNLLGNSFCLIWQMKPFSWDACALYSTQINWNRVRVAL